MKESLFGNEI